MSILQADTRSAPMTYLLTANLIGELANYLLPVFISLFNTIFFYFIIKTSRADS